MSVQGSCQCGAVAWSLDAEPTKAIDCNCSRCRRMGLLFDFFPTERFTLERGEDELTEYRFNNKVVERLFCKVCGVESFFRMACPDGSSRVGINMRCIEGLDLASLQIIPHDGAAK